MSDFRHGGCFVAEHAPRGLSTLGGFIETKYLENPSGNGPLQYPQSQTIMTFGHNGFLGYTPCTCSDVQITADHLRGKSTVPRGDMAFWWARSAQDDPKCEPDVEKAKKDLAKRMESWKDPNIPKILEHSLKTATIPTYVLPKEKTWAGERVVLVGDAAHGKLYEMSFRASADIAQRCPHPVDKESRSRSRMQKPLRCC